ncbi:MAG: UDP-N-acetylmuramoyl-tripeptide--D-alanyl-D-alanine ligase, partial [Tardiphaga sp.]|nr:UDP-N-acetylmuramoyl-tripeptide--D-alanyl-D-alanine ligase [Tardiphaga sp.]
MTQPLWTVDAMIAAMRAEVSGAPHEAITGISIDSRSLMPGDAYFAIKGDVHAGPAFVDSALAKGAALA